MAWYLLRLLLLLLLFRCTLNMLCSMHLPAAAAVSMMVARSGNCVRKVKICRHPSGSFLPSFFIVGRQVHC
uniref:Putative secreted protein n=1 Tax=Anopheles darlingi TaxID=43151 RepID=A0A2M4DGT6_ANODA